MPTYEYACKSCGEHLEVVQSFRDDALTVCPKCGGDLRRVFGSIGIAFKGSGFYRTDSRDSSPSRTGTKKSDKSESTSSSPSSPSPSPSPSSSSDGGSSSSTGDSKAAASS